jgi:tripartite-type tricarboxylate transporter receptor subunit TctC
MIHRRTTLALPLLALPRLARGAEWPERPINLIVAFGPGSAADIIARLLAPRLTAEFGQPVVVQNIAGASSTIGVDRVAKAAPDGHTLVLSGDGAIVSRPNMDPPTPYDPVRDLAPISLLTRTQNILVAHASVPARSLAELIALARAEPGKLSYGHSGVGFSQHLAMEALKQAAGIDLTEVPYAADAPLMLDLMQARVQLRVANGPVLLQRIRSGELRALAVISPERIAALPAVPTMAESGFPGVDMNAWYGVLAPARTPAAVQQRIHAGLAAAMGAPELAQKIAEMALVPVVNAPAEFAGLVPRELARMAALLDRLGLKRKA